MLPVELRAIIRSNLRTGAAVLRPATSVCCCPPEYPGRCPSRALGAPGADGDALAEPVEAREEHRPRPSASVDKVSELPSAQVIFTGTNGAGRPAESPDVYGHGPARVDARQISVTCWPRLRAARTT